MKGDDTTLFGLGMTIDWPLPTRPAVQQEPSVAPGQTATFSFGVKGVRAGVYRLPVRPVVDGVSWMDDEGIIVVLTVR